MAKADKCQNRELRLLQRDSHFEESMNVKRSEFKCEECSLSFHRKTSYDSHIMNNHKKKEEMAEIWKQLDKPDFLPPKIKPKSEKIHIVKSDLKHKIVVGLDGKIVKKYKAGIVELRKKVNTTNVIKSVHMLTPPVLAKKPTPIAPAKTSWKNQSFEKKGIQCLNCKSQFKNAFEFGVHTTRVEHRVPCTICFTSFENQCHLKRHQKIAHPHVCKMCDKLFSTEQHLDVHQRVSHRMVYQTMKNDKQKQISTNGAKSKSNTVPTIIISDSDSDEAAKKSNLNNKASGSNVVSTSKKHSLSANDMMQSLASIAQSKETKDPFSNMLSVMLEKPVMKKTPSVIYTSSRPMFHIQGTHAPLAKKQVQPVQNKVVALNPPVSTTTGLSSFLGQHVTSTVYSNLRPKGSFNLGKQVERVNLACRLAQHKQSLELKKLLKRHSQYKINDKDLKYKIPLGNLNEEFDNCPLFPSEEDIKMRTFDYTKSPLSVMDDPSILTNFGLNTEVMQRMFSEAVDSCILQEAWKLTHSSTLRRRSREVTSYSLKQKQECILDLHVQLLAIRNAAQTIVNSTLVKHITELKKAEKQADPVVAIDKPSDGQPSDKPFKDVKTINLDKQDAPDDKSKDPKSESTEPQPINIEKALKTEQAITTQEENQQSKTDQDKSDIKQEGNKNEQSENAKLPSPKAACQSIGNAENLSKDGLPNVQKDSAELSEQQNVVSNDVNNLLPKPMEVVADKIMDNRKSKSQNEDVNGMSDEPLEKVDNQEIVIDKQSSVKMITNEVCNQTESKLQIPEAVNDVSNKTAVENVDVVTGDSNVTESKKEVTNNTMLNKPSHNDTAPSENNQGEIEVKQNSSAKGEETCNEPLTEMERVKQCKMLTEEMIKAIPKTKSGENIIISEVQISSEYCGLLGKGHFNGMDFRWIVQFARPYVNTLISHRKEDYGEGSPDKDHVKDLKSNIIEQPTDQTTASGVQSTTFGSTGNTSVIQTNMASSETPTVTVESVFNSVVEATIIGESAPVVAQMTTLPTLTAFSSISTNLPVAAAPVALTPLAGTRPTFRQLSPVSVPVSSPKSSVVSPAIFPRPAPALFQVLPCESIQPTLTFTQPAQPITTKIVLGQGIQQVQHVPMVSSIKLAGLPNICQNSTVCVPAGVSQFTSIPQVSVGQKEFRSFLPKSPTGLLTLSNNNMTVLHQDILLKSTNYNQKMFTLSAAKPVVRNFDFVPTTQDSNHMPSETKTFSMVVNLQEEPNNKVFYTLEDCLDFEAGEIILFNNDIQVGKVPQNNMKKLFKCDLVLGKSTEQERNDNVTFLNSLYNIRKLYISGHLKKMVYQKLIPIAPILKCSWIPVQEKRTYAFLVESLLKKGVSSTDEDLERINTLLLDVLNRSLKKPLAGAKSSAETKTKTLKGKKRGNNCNLEVCLTNLSLPKNQSTVLVTEKKNAKNEHIGFVIKNKTGSSFTKDIIDKEHLTRKRSHSKVKSEEESNDDDGHKSKAKKDKKDVKTKEKIKENNDEQTRLRKRSIQKEGTHAEKTENELQIGCQSFVIPDETDPEIQFASYRKRATRGQKQ
ncbi:uncharacterized protein [Antedon mediterranea]|uniref:uncharacterized protein n=1 Tax=Antedon mediterranea TaxID=105859 RepID=UPI003AF81B53